MIRLDLNNPEFQSNWFSLPKPEAQAVLTTLKLIRQMTWEQLYRHKGLNWELIQSRVGPGGQRIYSLRITQQCRAVAYREGELLRFLSLHPDHDSAY